MAPTFSASANFGTPPSPAHTENIDHQEVRLVHCCYVAQTLLPVQPLGPRLVQVQARLELCYLLPRHLNCVQSYDKVQRRVRKRSDLLEHLNYLLRVAARCSGTPCVADACKGKVWVVVGGVRVAQRGLGGDFSLEKARLNHSHLAVVSYAARSIYRSFTTELTLIFHAGSISSATDAVNPSKAIERHQGSSHTTAYEHTHHA